MYVCILKAKYIFFVLVMATVSIIELIKKVELVEALFVAITQTQVYVTYLYLLTMLIQGKRIYKCIQYFDFNLTRGMKYKRRQV